MNMSKPSKGSSGCVPKLGDPHMGGVPFGFHLNHKRVPFTPAASFGQNLQKPKQSVASQVRREAFGHCGIPEAEGMELSLFLLLRSSLGRGHHNEWSPAEPLAWLWKMGFRLPVSVWGSNLASDEAVKEMIHAGIMERVIFHNHATLKTAASFGCSYS